MGGFMKPISWVGVVLLIAGIVILSGKISYTSDSESVAVGPVELVTKRKAEIPPWVGVLLIVGGGGLMVAGARRS
jgi:drug/metabolite transporter (DMT)-like permease